jgi:hypothetical protein
MAKRFRTKLSKEEFERAEIPSNHVAVELLRLEENATTHGGIYMGYNTDETWESDDETHPADIASVVGIVRKVPQKLYYTPDGQGMPWDTDMELQVGDTVWFNIIESLNSVELAVDKSFIRIIPFQDVYCAKRSTPIPAQEIDLGNMWYSKKFRMEHSVIMLNGYCLLEQVRLPKLSELDVTSEDHVYEDRGIIRYLGTPNRTYTVSKYQDNTELKVGDMAFIRPGYKPFLLERRGYFAQFDSDHKLYWCVQRRNIIMSI